MNLKILHFRKNKSIRYCFEVFCRFFFPNLKNSQVSLKSNIPLSNGITFPWSKMSFKGIVNLRHLVELIHSPIQSYSVMVVVKIWVVACLRFNFSFFQLFSADATMSKIFLTTKSWKKHPQKLLRIPQIHFFSLLPWLPKRPKQKKSCSKMWLMDQLYIKLVWVWFELCANFSHFHNWKIYLIR